MGGASLAAYSLLPREDGTPEWVPPNGFDMFSYTGFWKAKLIPRFDSKHDHGHVDNTLESGLSFDASTAGQTSMLSPEAGEMDSPFHAPRRLIEE